MSKFEQSSIFLSSLAVSGKRAAASAIGVNGLLTAYGLR
jgi:hypothetical protein